MRVSGWQIALCLAVAGAGLYVGTLGHGYVLDDGSVVRDHPVVREGRVGDAWTTPYWPPHLRVDAANWRPVATVSWTLERLGAGPPRTRPDGTEADPALPWFHGLTLVWYAAAVGLLFPLARRLTGSDGAAALACAWFAVHPAHTEAVAPVVGRIDCMATAAALATLVAWGRWRDTDDGRWCVAAAAAFALGLGSKESAAPVLAVLPLFDRWVCGRPWSALRTRGAWGYALLVGVLGVYALARWGVLGAHTLVHGQAGELSAWTRLGFAARNAVWSAGLLVAPVRLHHIVTTLPSEMPFTYPAPGAAASAGWLAVALPLTLGWIPLARRAPRAAWCWAAGVACWAPTSGLLPTAAGVALRFLLLPSAFVAIGAALAGQALVAARPRWARPLVVLAAGVAVAGASLTWWRVAAWRSNEAFFRAVLAEAPNSYKAHVGLGAAIAGRGGDLQEARAHLQRAIAIAGTDPIGVQAYSNLATLYEVDPVSRERFGPGAPLAEAAAVYAEGLAIVPDSSLLHHGLAELDFRRRAQALAAGDADAARRHAASVVVHLQATLASVPDAPEAPEMHISLAQLLGELDRAPEAAPHWQAALAGATARLAERERQGDADRAAQTRAFIAQIRAAAPPGVLPGG